MAVNTTKEGLEAMKVLINECASELYKLGDDIFDFYTNVNWNDETGSGFTKTLNDLRTIVLRPLPGLKETRDKMDDLICIVNKYNNIIF